MNHTACPASEYGDDSATTPKPKVDDSSVLEALVAVTAILAQHARWEVYEVEHRIVRGFGQPPLRSVMRPMTRIADLDKLIEGWRDVTMRVTASADEPRG